MSVSSLLRDLRQNTLSRVNLYTVSKREVGLSPGKERRSRKDADKEDHAAARKMHVESCVKRHSVCGGKLGQSALQMVPTEIAGHTR